MWRLDVAASGSGVTGDLLAHCIDTAIWLNGGIANVSAMTETFVKERKHNLTGKVEKVGIDDACAFLCRFKNGSLGLFESTRYARGHKALYTFEINGEHASIKWDLHDLHRLQWFDHRDEGPLRGWRSISNAPSTSCCRPMTSCTGNDRNHWDTERTETRGSSVSLVPDVRNPNKFSR